MSDGDSSTTAWLKAIERAAEAAKQATLAGYTAGDYSQDDHDGGVDRIHARIARAAVLAFLEGCQEDDIGSLSLSDYAALRAEAGASE